MGTDAFTHLRIEYGDVPLVRTDLPPEPVDLLQAWLTAAGQAGVSEPNGMALATCDREGQPHCRIVLLKVLDARGLTFFTNRTSDKGRQLAGNPRAAATFWWPAPRARQVRITGAVEATSEREADAWFAARPRRAQLCSAASPQSRPVGDRDELEAMVQAVAAAAGDGPVARPPHWVGYVLVPRAVEFWQGRDGRLHDRFRYTRGDRGWHVERLAP